MLIVLIILVLAILAVVTGITSAVKFVSKKNKEKVVAIDETWMFLKYPESANFLETLARRGRKYNTSLIVASQFLDEFLLNDEGKAIIKSCSTTMLMKQASGNLSEITDFFNLAKGTEDFLMSARPRRMYFKLKWKCNCYKV